MLKRLLIICSLFFILHSSTIHAYDDTDGLQVKIKKEDRIFNPDKRCCWATCEMLGRKQKITQLYGLTETHKIPPTSYVLQQTMQQYKVSIYQRFDYSDVLLLYGYYNHIGAGFIIDVYFPKENRWGTHAMVMVSYSKKEIKYINPDDKTLSIRTMSRETFNKFWTGWSFVLVKSRNKSVK